MRRRSLGCAAVYALWLLFILTVQQHLDASEARPGRALAQASCPVSNCVADARACIFYKSRGFRCKQCAPGFVLKKNGAQCICPAGTFQAVSGCASCPRHHYCTLGEPPKRCPGNLVTKGTGAKSIRGCANPPGYAYVPHPTNPTSFPCGKDTYSVGLRFQTQCSPCPSGFATSPNNMQGNHTSVDVCIAPPGFLMISSMVAPCSKGTFSSSYSGNYVPCTRCSAVKGVGITTEGAGAVSVDSCTWVELGYAAVNEKGQVYLSGASPGSTIAQAKLCPQNHYCPGGSPFVGGSGVPQPCQNGLRTIGEGATSADQCVAPPGWYVVPNSKPLRAAECPDGWYSETFGRSTSCTKCGFNTFEEPDGFGGVVAGSVAGWRSNRTIQIDNLDPIHGTVSSKLAVRGSSDSCYLRRGMGSQRVYDPSTGDWLLQAIFCPTEDSYYGISTDRYGVLLIPCFNCLPNMITSCQGVTDNALWGPSARTACDAVLSLSAVRDSGGSVVAYAEDLACVLQPGWGWVNSTFGAAEAQVTRTFVQRCPVNTYSPGGAYSLPCTPCNATVPGTTTNGQTGQVQCV